MIIPSRTSRFRPRAEASFLSEAIRTAWEDYRDRTSDKVETERVAEMLACYFETRIPTPDLDVLARYKCISYHDRCNVRVYDPSNVTGPYAEAFGFDLPRKVPVCGAGGYGYPSIAACEPDWGTGSPLRELDPYFAKLLKLRKDYKAEYKASSEFPATCKTGTGEYPIWAEIEYKFPVLGAWMADQRSAK